MQALSLCIVVWVINMQKRFTSSITGLLCLKSIFEPVQVTTGSARLGNLDLNQLDEFEDCLLNIMLVYNHNNKFIPKSFISVQWMYGSLRPGPLYQVKILRKPLWLLESEANQKN